MWPHKHKESFSPETRYKSRNGEAVIAFSLCHIKTIPSWNLSFCCCIFFAELIHGLRCCIANCEELISTMPSFLYYFFAPRTVNWEVTSSLIIHMWLIHLSGTTLHGLIYGTCTADNGRLLEHVKDICSTLKGLNMWCSFGFKVMRMWIWEIV